MRLSASWQQLPCPGQVETLLLSEWFPHHAASRSLYYPRNRDHVLANLFGSFVGGSVKYPVLPRLVLGIAFFCLHHGRPRTQRHLAPSVQLAARQLDTGFSAPKQASMAVSQASVCVLVHRLKFTQRFARGTVQDIAPGLRSKGTTSCCAPPT